MGLLVSFSKKWEVPCIQPFEKNKCFKNEEYLALEQLKTDDKLQRKQFEFPEWIRSLRRGVDLMMNSKFLEGVEDVWTIYLH